MSTNRRITERACRKTAAESQAAALRAAVTLLALASVACVGRGQRSERYVDWARPVFSAAEYTEHRARAFRSLGSDDVLLVPSGEGTSGGETFRQRDDFEYFTGLELPRSLLVLDGRSGRSFLFVPRSDPRFENAGRPNDFPGRTLATDPALRELSGVDSVAADDAVDAFLAGVLARDGRVLINGDRAGNLIGAAPAPFDVPRAGALLAASLQRTQPGLRIGNASELMARLRMVKSTVEITALREAARITMEGIARGAARVKPGIDERTLTGAFTADCLAQGAQRDAFTPIIKSGANSLWPWRILGAHYDRRNRTMRDGELVIYDVGCERNHYVSDVGRTFPVGGRFTRRQRALVEMVREVSDAVIAAARPGVTLADLQRVAVAAIPDAARQYMQAPLYFGHHIGLDAGDPSLADAPLSQGMVFTIEPWYYNHDEKVAVFLEDEILITATGSENLTAGLPRDADGLERLRAGRRGVRRRGSPQR